MKEGKARLGPTAAVVAALISCAPTARAESSLDRGTALYQARCTACHSPDHNRAGPAHRGVFGRHAGSVSGYDYSPALKASSLVWTRENLDRWLAGPERLVPGQKMGYSVPDAQDRSDLIVYLETLRP